MPKRWKTRYKGDVTVVNKHLDSKTKNQTEEEKSKGNKKNQERFKRNKQRRKKIFLLFLNWQKGKRGENIYNIKHSFNLVLDLGKF